jgi:ribulose-5-phosphate 4-epimerase/fuculose-1-phosphate aldolase
MNQMPVDQAVAQLLLRYAKLVVARGYVHNSLGNLAIRVAHPDFPHGVAYTKHAEVSLEEMTLDHVVITDIPTPRLLHGTMPTSVGHNLNREILRLRPDVGAVIHVHHDETIALFASGAAKELRVLSLEFPYVMAKPPYLVPSHLDVEQDVGPIKDFIEHTNSLAMENHGVTTLGRTVSEALSSPEHADLRSAPEHRGAPACRTRAHRGPLPGARRRGMDVPPRRERHLSVA